MKSDKTYLEKNFTCQKLCTAREGDVSAKKTQVFEDQLNELELIVKKLESGELPLEESLGLFEEGVNLFKNCKTQLSKVEKKISKLSENLKEEELE